METATIPFIQRLRSATALQHASIEALPLSKALLKEEVTRHDYAHYLLCMKGVMEFYDHTILEQIDEIIPQSSLRKKLPTIKEDLKYLREQVSLDEDITVLKTPVIKSKAFALGMAYVIEGSTLGGRVIIKHLSPRLQITETHGGIFFSGYGNETGSMWKSFLEGLSHFASATEDHEHIIEGAVAAFDMVSTHLKMLALNDD